MTIRLITGVPGSGKTYYAVNHLLTTYCNQDKETQEYTLKNDYTIITNIDSLTLPHINLDDALKASGKTIHDFFQVPYQEKISQKYKNIIYLLDEAQRYFPARNKIGSETWFYFEYHRHLGHDVYIITQDKKLMASNITLLAENELRACKRSFSLLGEFRYLLKSDNEIIDRITIRSKKSVFQVYKSFEASSAETVKNPFKKYIIGLAIASIIILLWFFKSNFVSGHFRPIRQYDTTKKEYIKENQIDKTSKQQNKTNQNETDQEKIDYQLSYYYHNKDIYVLDPITKQFFPIQNFPKNLKSVRFPGLKLPRITALYTPQEIASFSPPRSSGVESAPPDYTTEQPRTSS